MRLSEWQEEQARSSVIRATAALESRSQLGTCDDDTGGAD